MVCMDYSGVVEVSYGPGGSPAIFVVFLVWLLAGVDHGELWKDAVLRRWFQEVEARAEFHMHRLQSVPANETLPICR